MNTFLQQPFFTAAGYALITNIIAAAMLWCIVYLLNKYINNNSQQRYITAFAAQLVCLVLLVVSFQYFYRYNDTGFYTVSNSQFFSNILSFTDKQIMPLLAQLYFFAGIYQLLRFIADIITVRRNSLNHIHHIEHIKWQQFIDDERQLLNIQRNINLHVVEGVQSPAVTGFFKPVILMPLAAINRLSSFEMEAVLMHELAHIKRADYLVYLVQSFIQKILFFNPFVLLISKITEAERENCCDDWVLNQQYNKLLYAEALYKLAVTKVTVAPVVPFAGKKDGQLLARIQRIVMNRKDAVYSSAPAFSVALLVCALSIFSSMFITMPAQKTTVVKTIPAALITPSSANNNYVNKKEKSLQVWEMNASTVMASKAKPIVTASQKSKPPIEIKEVTKEDNVLSEPRINSLIVPVVAPKVATNLISANTTTLNLNNSEYQNLISYNTFKNIEAMLSVSGDSCISIKESSTTKDSYKKLLTINSISKNGDKHTYTIVIELYQ